MYKYRICVCRVVNVVINQNSLSLLLTYNNIKPYHPSIYLSLKPTTLAATATSSSNANNPSNDNVAVNTTTTTTMTASTTTATSNPEQDRYINEIVKLTCTLTNQQQQQQQKTNDYNSATLAYSTITNTQQSQPQSQQASYSVTPLINRRSLFATKIEKAVQTIKNNYQGSSLSPVTTTTTNSSYPTTNINVNATTSQQTSNNGLCANSNCIAFFVLFLFCYRIIHPIIVYCYLYEKLLYI